MKKTLFRKQSKQAGFSLMELMVGLALSGVVFMILMTLIGQTARFSSFFSGTAAGVEGTVQAVSVLSSVMPQIVRIRSCNCRGVLTNVNNLSNCTWNEAQPWYNPILNGGVVNGVDMNALNGNLGTLVLDADYEDFWGGNNSDNTSQLRFSYTGTGISQLYSSYVDTNFLGGCDDYDSVSDTNRRGCKRRLRLYFNSPTMEDTSSSSSSNASKSGRLTVMIGGIASPTEATLTSSAMSITRIGDRSIFGSVGLGLTEFSCGLLGTAGGVTGLNFVMNMKIKARNTSVQTPNNSKYESWYPRVDATNGYTGTSGKLYDNGLFRDIRLKFALRNIGTRGIHHWRSRANLKCKPNGTAATTKELCCSMAISGGTCAACLASGQGATSADQCCSEKLSSGVCI